MSTYRSSYSFLPCRRPGSLFFAFRDAAYVRTKLVRLSYRCRRTRKSARTQLWGSHDRSNYREERSRVDINCMEVKT
jgi:hypothetical protein